MVLGVAMTALNLVLNVILIRGLGPIPAFGAAGSAMGTVIASGLVAVYAIVKLWRGGLVVLFPRGGGLGPDWGVIRSLFRFGLPTGIQGVAMNVGGALTPAFIGSVAQSAAAQAAYAVSYSQLFSLITWTSLGLMGATAAAGQNLGAGKPDRAEQAAHVAARIGLAGAAFIGVFFSSSRSSCSPSSECTIRLSSKSGRNSCGRSASPVSLSLSLWLTREVYRGLATPGVRSTFRSSHRSSCRWASASSFGRPARWSRSISGSPFS